MPWGGGGGVGGGGGGGPPHTNTVMDVKEKII